MRLRNDPLAVQKLQQHPEYVIPTPGPQTLDLNQYFNHERPINIEVGMGKGNFIIQQALKHPTVNFIGIEKNITVCAKALNKALKLDHYLENLKFIAIDATKLPEIFKHHSIDQMFLNFSDPWPKKRHAKNRLTHPRFLNLYAQILKPNALIEFKTDNQILYEFSLEQLKLSKITNIIYTTNDLYSALDHALNQDNIPTEYETRFAQTTTIKKIVFQIKA